MTEETTVSKKRWYVLQAFSGFESRVALTLREYIKQQQMESLRMLQVNVVKANVSFSLAMCS